MNKTVKYFLLSLLFSFPTLLSAQHSLSELAKETKKRANFMLVTDLGRNGYYEQKNVAATMGRLAEEGDIEFIVSSGDLIHYIGVRSVLDPLWMTNFELVYDHPELQVEWYPALGNHEYRGSTQAVLDYTGVSRRWCMPSRYYMKSIQSKGGKRADIFIIDTPPLISKYRKDPETYPDAHLQDDEAQLKWLDSALASSTADWKIVVGHHPIYADTSKDESERLEMQQRLDPLLLKHKVDFYCAGHIHNFQHVRRAGSPVEYVVVGSGSKGRKVKAIEGAQYVNPVEGFALFSLGKNDITLYFVDKEGNVLHKISR